MASRKFKVDIDLNKHSLNQAKVENQSSAPGTPTQGQIYFDTTLNKFGVYNGTIWVYMGDVNSWGLKNHLVSGDDITVDVDYQYFIYGDLTIDAGATLTNNGEVVILNGDLINLGTFNNLGTLKLIDLETAGLRYKETFSITANVPKVITHNLNTLDFTYNIREGNNDVTVQLTRVNANKVSLLSLASMTATITLIA